MAPLNSTAWNIRIKNRITRTGIMSTLADGAAGLSDLFFRYILTVKKYVIIERDLADPIPEIIPGIACSVRMMEPGDLALVNKAIPEKANLIRKRLDEGMPALVALSGKGELMSYYFMAIGKDPNRGVPVKLKKDEGVCVETLTLPQFRGNRVASLLKNEGLKFLKSRGCSKVLGAYAPNHTSVRKDLLLNGYKETKALLFINILGLHIRVPWKL